MVRHLGHLVSQSMLVVTMACSQPTSKTSPTLDFTSEDALERSVAAVLDSLDEEKAKELWHAVDMIDMSTWAATDLPDTLFSRAFSDGKIQPGSLEYMQPLNGMTAQELEEYAKTLPNWITREEMEELARQMEQLQCPGYL